MFAPLPVSMLWDAKILELIASAASAIALWAQTHARRDAVDDLTERIRHPIRWRMSHPAQALRRAVTPTPQPPQPTELYYPPAFTEWAIRMRGEFYTLSREERHGLYETWRRWECPDAPSLDDRDAVSKIMKDLQ